MKINLIMNIKYEIKIYTSYYNYGSVELSSIFADMTDYKIAMEGITGTSTVITHLKTAFYAFRIYAFNEYFKGKTGSTVKVNLNLASSLSSITFDDINTKVIASFIL